jgi:hypothetical protein
MRAIGGFAYRDEIGILAAAETRSGPFLYILSGETSGVVKVDSDNLSDERSDNVEVDKKRVHDTDTGVLGGTFW